MTVVVGVRALKLVNLTPARVEVLLFAAEVVAASLTTPIDERVAVGLGRVPVPPDELRPARPRVLGVVAAVH